MSFSSTIPNVFHLFSLIFQYKSLHDAKFVGKFSDATITSTSHPIHLHGHGFQVIDMGTLEQYRTGQTAYANSTLLPVIKDTVSLSSGSFVTVRFKSCNPGYWLFHCHLEIHMHTGMYAILKIGNKTDMVPPPAGFATCGDYLLPVLDG